MALEGLALDRVTAMTVAAAAAVMMMVVATTAAVATGREHTVGRRAGWTIPAVGNVNYSTWAAGFTFSVGDVLVFKYDATLHDVLQVSEGDYNTCDASNPEAKYIDGNSFVALDQAGSWFFICGVPGHCLAGQKLQVQVSSSTPPSMAPSTNTLLGPPVPSTSPNSSPRPSQTLGSPTPTSPHIIGSLPTPPSPPKSLTTSHPLSWAPQHPFEHMILVILVFASWLTYGNVI